jgi:hypothetical protein
MKVKSIQIKNIGLIESETIEFNKPLILFYGEIRQGKTTILNCVRWVMGGAFPADILRHGSQEGGIRLDFDTGSITREFYLGKDGSTKAREVAFIQNGTLVSSPVKALKALLNPFLLDQDYLRNKTEPERKRYFVEVFGVKTDDIDEKLTVAEGTAKLLRSKISAYGDINLTPYPRVRLEDIMASLQTVRSGHAQEQLARQTRLQHLQAEYNAFCAAATQHNYEAQARLEERGRVVEQRTRNLNEMETLRVRMAELVGLVAGADEWMLEHPPIEKKGAPPVPKEIYALQAEIQTSQPDTADLEKRLVEGSAQNVMADQFDRNVARAQDRAKDERMLVELEAAVIAFRKEKIARLAKLAEDCKIPGVEFDERGELVYEGTQAGMLSTSQIMKLSAELSGLYPTGFGLDLIDRAESLGKSIFAFIDKAKAENKTILATIVGEKPASVPADVGVFVVENGKLS